MPPKSPQQKKAESYKNDRRNTYGENSKSSRKGIAGKKRRHNRAERRLVREALPATSIELERIEEIEGRLLQKQYDTPFHMKLKTPDTPLGEVVVRKMERRARLGMISSEEVAQVANQVRRRTKTKQPVIQ